MKDVKKFTAIAIVFHYLQPAVHRRPKSPLIEQLRKHVQRVPLSRHMNVRGRGN